MEEWKQIKDYPKYEVSSYGRIKSYQKFEDGKILKGGLDYDGYRLILLYNERGRVTRKVHRLVAEAFIPNPNKKKTVNHINNHKDDNRVDNLEWATNSENVKHAFDNGFKDSSHKRPVVQFDLETREILRVYESAQATKKDGFNRGHVGEVCRGNRRTHKGFGWRYF